MRQGLRDHRLTGIRRQRRGDRVIRYHRATGIRLPDDIPETHPAFVDAWARAEALARDPLAVAHRKAPVKAGSVAEAVRVTLCRAEFKELSDVYKASLRLHLDAIRAAYGDLPARALLARHIKADLDKLPANPANQRLKAWRWLFRGTEPDPTAGLSKRRVRTEGYAAWSAADVARFRARWPVGSVARTCFELVLWTGARTCDAVTLSRAQVGADGVLVYRQSKTGGKAHVPWTAPLPSWAAGWAAERAEMIRALDRTAGGFTFLEANGRVRSVKGLGNVINDAARDAGLTGRTAHGLRKTRLTAIADAGGSAHAIMAWGGHKTLTEAQHYTQSAQLRRLVTGEEQEVTCLG